MSERLRWFNVTGPPADCRDCEWGENGDDSPRRLIDRAKKHALATGHEVLLERGQSARIHVGEPCDGR